MKRLIAHISGKVQKAGYRSKVVTIARDLGIKGSVQNLPDGRVRVIAEGKEADLQRFAEALNIRNAIVDVRDLQKEYSIPTGEYDGFYKLVGEGETDERLDKSVEYLKELVDVTKNGFHDLGHKMDQMLDKQDQMLDKQDQMLDKQDQMLDKQDQMLDKQDQMLDKQDQMLDKQDQMLDKQDQMLDKQDETTGEIRGLRTDIKSHIDLRFERIEADLAEVKTALKERGII